MASGSGSGNSHGHPHAHTATAMPAGNKTSFNPRTITIWITAAVVVVIFGLLVSRGCSPKEEDSNKVDLKLKPGEWSKEVLPESSASPVVSPNREIVRTLTLAPNTWSEWVEPGAMKFRFVWATPDNKISGERRLKADGRILPFTITPDKDEKFGSDLCDLRFKHEKGGTVVITLTP